MLKALQNKTLMTRILLGVVVALLGAGMLLYLVPQGGSDISSSDTVADVGGLAVTVVDVRQQMDRISRGNPIPKALEPLYAQQILNQLVYQRMLEIEAKRLGIRVSQQEHIERIRQLVPSAFLGDSVVGMEQYAAEVQNRFQMGVQEFEGLVRQGLLEEKFRRLVTDGITVSPPEIQEEFVRRNQKVKFDYIVIAPDSLESKITPSDAELEAYFAKNKARYVVPERRVARYALLDINQLRQRTPVPEADLRAYYTANIDQYKLQNRAHVEHILFKTVGKTDAEVEEIRKKAEDVLKQARHGAKFEDLAKKYSEDTTKDKGGDLGWIVQGQTVAEFEKAAFSLPKGAISDLVKTQYGFHIIKVLDRENARTKPFEEVRAEIQPILAAQKADQVANEQADKISAAIRAGGRMPLEQLAKQFNLTVAETPPLAVTDPILELGNSQEVRSAIFRLRVGELNLPIRTDRGYVVLSLKEILATHPGTLAEVRDKVLADFRREKAVDLAKSRAEELSQRARAGENLAAVAKALGFELKTSDSIARSGNVTGLGSGRQLGAVFALQAGQASAPIFLGPNWVVAQVVERTEAHPEDFDKQRAEIEQQLLQSKRELAYEAFRNALEDRLKKEGQLKYNPDTLKRLTSSAGA
jgi:peptidyl-prolyl cis-trans isomerase D